MNHKRFDYYKPETLEELNELKNQFAEAKTPFVYYSGGTELMSQFRKGMQVPDAVIDIKGIEELHVIEKTKSENGNEKYKIGSCVSLNDTIDYCSKTMGTVIEGIADHTIRNAITLGGNICGRLAFREAVLPLLARNALVGLYDGELTQKPLSEVFQGFMRYPKGTLVHHFEWEEVSPTYERVQRFDNGIAVDYPLVTQYVYVLDDRVFVSVSGFAPFPMTVELSYKELMEMSVDERAEKLNEPFMAKAKKDANASAEYRKAVLAQATQNVISDWEAIK